MNDPPPSALCQWIQPWQEGETVLEAAKAFQAQDEAKLVAAQTGNSKREWVDKRLADKGVEVIDGMYKG